MIFSKQNELLCQQNFVFVKKVHPNAKLPTQSVGDVGFDLSCVDHVVVKAGKTHVVNTGIQVAQAIEPLILQEKILGVPFMKIEGRSGLAAKGIFPVGGIIDPSYRGEIKAILFNSSDKDFEFNVGDRIAQLVIYYTLANAGYHTQVTFVETDDVKSTSRGENGFGSSGS